MIPSVPPSTIATLLLGSSAALLLAGLPALAWRSASAAQRHLLWLLSFVAAAAIAAAALPHWQWRLAILPPQPAQTMPAGSPQFPAPRGGTALPSASGMLQRPATATPSAHPAPPSPHGGLRPATLLTIVWTGGLFFTLSGLGVGLLGLDRLRRRARPASAPLARRIEALGRSCGMPRPVPLLISSEIASPLAAGVFRPCLIFPAAAHHWSPPQFDAAALHELAHLRRGDVAALLFARLALALHWCNPLAWLALRQLRREAERAADDLASQHSGDYAASLVAVARTLRAAPSLYPAYGLTEGLEARVRRLLDPSRSLRIPPAPFSCAAILLVAGFSLTATTITPTSAPPAGAAYDFAGLITDPAGRPLPGAVILLSGASPFRDDAYPECAKSAVTDYRGKFTIPNLDANLHVNADIYAPGCLPRTVADIAQATPVHIRLSPWPRISRGQSLVHGRVLDASGNPVPQALVKPVEFGGPPDLIPREGEDPNFAVTAPDGTFSFPTSNRNPWVKVSIDSSFAPRTTARIIPGQEAVIKLPRAVEISGRLMQEGRPVPHAEITYFSTTDEDDLIGRAPITASDANGYFVIANAPPGRTIQLSAKRRTLPPGAVPVLFPVNTSLPGSKIDVGEVPVRAGLPFVGYIALANGTHLAPGRRVMLENSRDQDACTIPVQPDGSFQFAALPDEDLRISSDEQGDTITIPDVALSDTDNFGVEFIVPHIRDQHQDRRGLDNDEEESPSTGALPEPGQAK